MAGSLNNGKDSMDISELASLNEDISDDMIEQLQQQLSQNISSVSENKQTQEINENDDSTLFEEPISNSPKTEIVSPEPIQSQKPEQTEKNTATGTEKKEEVKLNQDFDDNFIKKYKAKLKNKQKATETTQQESVSSLDSQQSSKTTVDNSNGEQIESLSQGKITEKPMTKELKEYNDSLDFLDGNVKYSKYVIYIDPENVDFIEGLTVKERKNLINRILRQQDDITITKRRFKSLQGVMNHVIIAILTLAISIPLVYSAINASLEATINNHRNAQTNWQTLYKEHGKITQN